MYKYIVYCDNGTWLFVKDVSIWVSISWSSRWSIFKTMIWSSLVNSNSWLWGSDSFSVFLLFASDSIYRLGIFGTKVFGYYILIFIRKDEICQQGVSYFCLRQNTKIMLKSGALLCIIMFAFSTLLSQEEVYKEVKNTEVSILSAPAFTMLGVLSWIANACCSPTKY